MNTIPSCNNCLIASETQIKEIFVYTNTKQRCITNLLFKKYSHHCRSYWLIIVEVMGVGMKSMMTLMKSLMMSLMMTTPTTMTNTPTVMGVA